MRPAVISPIRVLALLAGAVIGMSYTTRPLWSQSNPWPTGAGGAIYYNGGNFGIGITSPVNKLDILGQLSVSDGTWKGGGPDRHI